MGRGTSVVLETRIFEKKGDAIRFFREMLNRYELGDKVSDVDARDLSALLKLHTEYPEKVGKGVEYFKVDANLHGTKSFYIYRVDGSHDDFSYIHCISPKH